MGFLDRLSGGKATEARQQQEAEAAAAAQAAAASASMPSTSAPTMAPGLLDNMPPGLSFPEGLGGTQGRLYNPYEGLSQAVGGKSQTFKLPERPEFVFEEEASARRRGWTENIQLYTGLGYVSGAALGVGLGVYNVLTTKSEITNETIRLRGNRWLNAAGSNAKPLGNGCGILGLYFAITEGVLYGQLDNVVPDSVVSVLAGAATGALFRTPRGPRQALIAGVVGAAAGAGVAGLRSLYPST